MLLVGCFCAGIEENNKNILINIEIKIFRGNKKRREVYTSLGFTLLG